jgi:putative flippase GtrA
MDIKLLLKTSSVSIIGVLVDIITLTLLHKYSSIGVKLQLYISSICRIVVLFIGHSLYTFKGYSGNYLSNCMKFFTWEILFMIAVVNIIMFIKKQIYDYLNKLSPEEIKGKWFTPFIHHNYLINKKEKHKHEIIGKSNKEIKGYLIKIGLTEDQIKDLIEELDEDSNGIITYKEYENYTKNKYLLDTYTLVFFKQFVTLILFLLLDIPVYKRIFK